MSKYDPLTERLAGHDGPEWRASFAEVEEVLGFPLPKGARTGAVWWRNTGAQPHQRAWTGAGWETADVDHAQGQVTFRKTAADPQGPSAEPEPPPVPVPAASQLVVGDEPAILKRLEATPKWHIALVAGGLGVVAALSVFAIRGLRRK
ncbi:MAG: hypothetical protein ACHP7A_05320 [Caulobacterales bacterium]|jgi:hypothetical protein